MSTTTTTTTKTWSSIPDEIKFAILKADTLSVRDVRAFSSVDTHSYHLCLPILFNTVKLPSREALDNFLDTVPSSYYPFIQELDICTKPQGCSGVDRVGDQSDEITEKIGQILSRGANRLTQLSLCIGGSLRNDIVPVFGLLTRLHTFALENWSDEEVAPLSERLAMALVVSLPALRDLSLARITRSAMYAPELLGGTVPVVHNDADVPAPASNLLELRLPSLLGITHLRRLRIRETHLGDQLWGTVTATSKAPELEVLDLGASPYETPAFNDQCTQRILARAPTRFLHTFSLSTGASTSASSCPPSPTAAVPTPTFTPPQYATTTDAAKPLDDAFPSLRTLHLTPLIPPPLLSSTLAQPALAQSPVHTLSCAFDPADAAEGCRAVEGFLWERGMNPLSLTQPKRLSKRTRSGSLAIIPSSSSTGAPHPLKRRSTLSASGGRASYPSLQTLSISLSPPEPPATPAAYSPKLAARIQARRAREAEERAQAARSLVKCCQILGVHAEVTGIEIGDINEEEDEMVVIEEDLATACVVEQPVVRTTLNGRSRSKTT